MKIIRGMHNLKKNYSSSIITIGNFDGIHLGHQKILDHTSKISKKYNMPTILIFFEPQPLEFLRKKNFPTRLTTFSQKIKYFSNWKINNVLCIKFNAYFASLTAKDFIINILIKKLHVKFIIIGEDFKFGAQRDGNSKLLEITGKKNNFKLITVKSFYHDNVKISSTRIREALSHDNIILANRLLGRPISIYGRVVHGNKIGRTIGYPTANVLLNKNFSLKNGVYAIKICCGLNKKLIGISNISTKLSNIKNYRIIEVHLFNTQIDLYGKKIEIFIYTKIRNEKIFSSSEALKKQIDQDIKKVNIYFQNKRIDKKRAKNE